MKILLTGAAGGIGSTLGYYLYKSGHTLTLLDNFRNGYDRNLTINGEKFGKLIPLSVDNIELQDIIEENDFDCIIHLAAITALPDCEINSYDTIKMNVNGTLNILNCARKWNVPHVIFASTSAVYENNKESIFSENLEINPRLLYSLSKKMGEEICESYRTNYDMKITTLRFFNVFGPRQDIHRKNPPLLNYLVREVKGGNAPMLHSDGKQQRDYIHVDDVVRLVDICLDKKPNDTFNVCTGTLISVNQIVEYVCDVFNSNIKPTYRDASKLWDTYPELFEGPYPLDKEIVAKETNKYSRGTYEKAYRLLGWEPNTDLESLFKKVIREIEL